MLAACAPEDPEGPADLGDGVRVERVPSALFYRGGAPEQLFPLRPGALLSGARFTLRLGARLRVCMDRCDALISHWLLPCGALAALLGPAGRPHLAIAHSSDVHLLRRLRATALVGLIAARADLVYSAAALRVPGAPGRVVPMGIETAHFAPAGRAEREALRRRLGLRGPTALFLGRLVPVKGVAGLLGAVAELPGLDLLVAGEGPERPALERRAARLGGRVRFVGEVRGVERRDLLCACDVLALPALELADGRTEGAPTVLLEAMSAGCPAVASAVGGAAELLGEAGVLVRPADRLALQAGLRQALAPGLAQELRRRGMERARDHDWSVIGPRLFPG